MVFELFTDGGYLVFRDSNFESGLARIRGYVREHFGEEVAVLDEPWYTCHKSTAYPVVGVGGHFGKVIMTAV